LDDLKASLADSGLLEPIVVRPAPDQIEHYELIAGERRFRFARSLGWSTILAHVIPMTDEQAAANNLLENLQREDLSLLEQADAYDRLMTTFGWSQNEVAKRLKVRSSYISSVRKVARIPRLRDGITAETLKGRVARELGRLVDAGGTERVPGALDLFLRWVALRDPTMAVVQARVDECLATGRVPASVAQASEPLSQPLVRRSWAEIQWERWERRDRPYVLQASLVELQEAESRVATILSDIQQAIQTRTGTVSPAASVTPDPNPSKAGGPSARS
jgi:ParB/RepB/Spo0J family partition protein